MIQNIGAMICALMKHFRMLLHDVMRIGIRIKCVIAIASKKKKSASNDFSLTLFL
jgi:hypothetical protein